MKKIALSIGLLGLALPLSYGQVIVDEQFNYSDLASLQANWGTSPSLSLNTADGNPAPSASHTGVAAGAGNVNLIRWTGPFSLTPTDAAPVRLTADIFSSGNANQANTVGLRQMGGIAPLFEMGHYRSFDNDVNGQPPPSTQGHGVRTINIGTDLTGQDWVRFGDNYTGWARWEATFSQSSVTVNVDYDINGTFDFTYTESGPAAIGAFGDLRIHSPVASNGGGFSVDNIRLEVVPEPSTWAFLTAGAAGLFLLRRRQA